MARRRMWTAGLAALVLLALTMGGAVSAQTATPTPTAPAGQQYVVQVGDNLGRIAQRFGVTTTAIIQANGIVDANRIQVGQVIIIPAAEGSATATQTLSSVATATPSLSAALTAEPTAVFDTVRSGDTLAQIARRNNTTIDELIRLNNIVNPDLIIVGQRLMVRTGRIAPTTVPGQTQTGTVAASSEYGTGLTIFIQDQPPAEVIDGLNGLPLDWVKIDVAWSRIEPSPGVYNFVVLDEAVDALIAKRIRVLVTLSGTPVWARSVTQENGPPDDLTPFATFAGALADHFTGRIAAYQIWNEPNLRREWASDRHPISAASYYDLLRQARDAIKAADPGALVISAGLAPTGFNDGVNALNDRLYLQSLYDLGLLSVVDGVAVHALGFANPPDAECCLPSDGVESHFENRSFYFKNTLEDYHALAEANGDFRPLWITKFGWGTNEDTDAPGDSFRYVTYTSLIEQANFVPRAFGLAQELGYVGPMFLFNYNGCQFTIARPEECYFSLLGPSSAPRAAFNALRAMR